MFCTQVTFCLSGLYNEVPDVTVGSQAVKFTDAAFKSQRQRFDEHMANIEEGLRPKVLEAYATLWSIS